MSTIPNLFDRLMTWAKKASKPRGKKLSADEEAASSIPEGVPLPTSADAPKPADVPLAEPIAAWATEEGYPEGATGTPTIEERSSEQGLPAEGEGRPEKRPRVESPPPSPLLYPSSMRISRSQRHPLDRSFLGHDPAHFAQ